MKKKLLILFVLVVFFPLFLSVLITSSMMHRQIDEMAERRASLRLQVVSNIFDEFIDDISLKARIIAQLNDVRKAVLENDKIELIQELNFIRQDLNLNYYGAVIEVYNNDQLMASEPQISQRLTSEAPVREALRGEIKHYSSFDNNKLKFSSVYPVYEPSRPQPVGVVSVSFFVSDKLAEEVKKIANTEVFFFYKKNKDDFNVFASSFNFTDKEYSQIFDYLKGNAKNHIQINNDSYLLKYIQKNSQNSDYFISVAMEKTDMENILSSIQKWLYIIDLLSVFFALVMAAIFSRRIIEPINKLVSGVQKIGAGDLDTELSIKSNDEFEFLSDSFNSMRLKVRDMIEKLNDINEALDKKVFELSVVNQINQVLIKQSNQSLLNEILMIIVNTLKVERASIMILDPNSEKLMLKFFSISENTDSKKVKEYISFEKGEGIAGYVAQNGEAVIANKPEQDPRFKKYDDEGMNDEINNIMCVPLLDDMKIVLGVVNVVNGKRDFSFDDCNLLQTIAHQIAIAIQNANLYEQAITDGMTKLFIHRYFQARMDTEIKRAIRYETKVSLIMLDIDHFKKFNDTYGHPVGDLVIKRVAEELRHAMRDNIDIAARYGGEEFAVILPETDLDGAFLLAERFRKYIEDMTVFHENLKLNVTISVGCAEFPSNADTKESLIDIADKALYASKQGGRNRVTSANDLKLSR